MAYNEDSSASGHDEPWIQWFCGLKGHEMFCEVERSYIEDGFNLYGLRACVSNFSDCLDLILDRIGPDDSDDSHLTQSACTLYGLIHARYIITAHGLDAMYNKYAAKEFGTCPLVQCQGQPVLPVGLRDEVGYDSVKIFCPKCQCVYHPPPPRRGGSGTVDGASFGTTFAHLFLMTFSNLVPDALPADSVYVPRVFGFRVHQSARQRPERNAPSSSQQPLPGANSNRGGSGRNAAAATAAAGTMPSGASSAAAPAAAAPGGEAGEADVGNSSSKPAARPAESQNVATFGNAENVGEGDMNAVSAVVAVGQDGAVLSAAVAVQQPTHQDGSGAGPGAGGKVAAEVTGSAQGPGAAADLAGNGQAKRKPNSPENDGPTALLENNGTVDASFGKQAKRQKRPANGEAT